MGLISSACVSQAVVVDTTWIGGAGPAGWWEPSNWSAGTNPHNNGGTEYNIFIDGGDTGTDSIVYVSGGITNGINNLTIDAGDVLLMDGHTDGFIVDGTGAGGTVTNNGLIQMTDDQAGMEPFFIVKGPVTFSGAGTFQLEGGAYFRTNGVAGDSLTNGSAHTIRGGGVFGGDGAGGQDANFVLHNQGLITTADLTTGNPGGEFTVNFADGSTNSGEIENIDGSLTLEPIGGASVFLNNAGGLIESSGVNAWTVVAGVDGGVLRESGTTVFAIANIKNATLETLNNGRFWAESGFGRLDSLTLNGDLEFALISDEPVMAGDWTNNGDIQVIDKVNDSQVSRAMHIDGVVTLNGSGSMGFPADSEKPQIASLDDETPDRLVIGADQTFYSLGSGYGDSEYSTYPVLGDGSLTIINNGLIQNGENGMSNYPNLTIHQADGTVNNGVIRNVDGSLWVQPFSETIFFLDNTNGLIEATGNGSQNSIASVAGGALRVDGSGNVMRVANIKDATLESLNDGRFWAESGYGRLDSLTLDGVMMCGLQDEEPVMTGNWTNNGDIRIFVFDEENADVSGFVRIDGTLTMDGTGSIGFDEDSGFARIASLEDETPDQLVIGEDQTFYSLGSNYGYDGYSTDSVLGDGNLTIINNGLIQNGEEGMNDNSGLTIHLAEGTVNNGVIRNVDGTLWFQPYTQNIFFLDNTEGLIEATGNGDDTLVVSVDGGTLRVDGQYNIMYLANIRNATLESANGGLFRTESDYGSLENLTLNGVLEVTLRGYEEPVLAGLMTNNGAMRIIEQIEDEHTFGLNTVKLDGAVTFAGNGSLNFAEGDGLIAGANASTDDTLINEAQHTIHGAGTIGGNQLVLQNHGLIRADVETPGMEYLEPDLILRPAAGSANFGTLHGTNEATLGIIPEGVFDNTNGVLSTDGGYVWLEGEVHGGVVEQPGAYGHVIAWSGVFYDFTNNGTILSSNGVLKDFTNSADGAIILEHSAHWAAPVISGEINNDGFIHVLELPDQGGAAIVQNEVILNGSGALNFDDTLTSLQGDSSDGADSLTNQAGHTITGKGTLGGDGLALINEGIVAPGLSPGVLTIDGGMTFTDTATLEIEIGGLVAATDYDVLHFLNGNLELDGALAVSLINGFESTIQATDSFTIVSSQDASSIEGAFANLTPGGRVLTSDGGASFAVSISSGQVVLTDYRLGPTLGADPQQDWTWENFGDLDSATEASIWGEEANPDADPFTNLEEYAFVLDPGKPMGEGDQPIDILEALDAGQFTIRVRQRKATSDANLNFVIEVSETLMPDSWSTVSATEIPPRVSINDEAEWVTYQLPAPIEDRQFLRLEVNRTEP